MPDKNTHTPQSKAGGGLLRIGITQGDANGVGIELILKTFSDTGMFDFCIPVVYGCAKVVNQHRKALGINLSYRLIPTAAEATARQLNFINCSDVEIPVEFGKQSPDAGHAAFVSLEQAVHDLTAGHIDALVTAPINKASIQSSNFRFVGHTEYLQDRTGTTDSEPLMILCNDFMRVSLVTTHLPISEVATAITQEKIEKKGRLLYQSLRRDFQISAPRIAVLALNPHAGDSGVLGKEEEEIIRPAIQTLSEEGIACYGPFAADGFFGAEQYRYFDGILAMYHDQGLAPFKGLAKGSGVNFTAGLLVVRTSPDHGTAYDIAGKGEANPDSFRQAIYMAIDIYRNRKIYDEAHANPLPKIYQERKERP